MKSFHKNIRLQDYDYASAGAYFVSVVVEGRECCLSHILGENCELMELGNVVACGWKWLAEQYPYVSLDEFIVMPNHFHGILHISENVPQEKKHLPLGRLVSAFKARTTRNINRERNMPGQRFWQKDFYEHVIRGDRDLTAIRQYIVNNPLQWAIDEENPERGIT